MSFLTGALRFAGPIIEAVGSVFNVSKIFDSGGEDHSAAQAQPVPPPQYAPDYYNGGYGPAQGGYGDYYGHSGYGPAGYGGGYGGYGPGGWGPPPYASEQMPVYAAQETGPGPQYAAPAASFGGGYIGGGQAGGFGPPPFVSAQLPPIAGVNDQDMSSGVHASTQSGGEFGVHS